jgi:tetratricopeptide (TPR) repeat protein
MNIKRNIVVFVAACLIVFSQPLYVSADRCDDVMEEASRIFDSAMAASRQKEYAEAIELYEEAEEYYKKASEMRNCRCPKIAGSAKRNITICRNNAANNKKALENQENYGAEVEIVEIYNQAKMKFNRGNSYARSQLWERAISAFEEAEEIWESIASTETENGRRAMQSAEQARDMADLARQRLEM